METGPQTPDSASTCICLDRPYQGLHNERNLGLDDNLAEVSLFVCQQCRRHWLRYFYELEAFTASGRWYLGAITAEQAAPLKADNAKGLLESLDWYFYGGSYFGGRNGKTSGKIR